MSEIRIFWPLDTDIYRSDGIYDLIMQLESDEREVALNQLTTYRYADKENEYTTKVICAEIDGIIVGYILYRKTWIRPNTFETAQTLVHKDYRGQRIATKLRDAVWKDIKQRGGDYCISATLDPTHMKTAKQIDHLEDGWIIVGRRLNSI